MTQLPVSHRAGSRGLALVRPVSPKLADGIVTYMQRTPVDVALASRQHAAYLAALADHGWQVCPVAAADECPDSVFIEDTLVVCEDVAVLTRPGAPQRRAELDAVAAAVEELGLKLARLTEPATLDGGDVLQVSSTVYVGLGARTNTAGMAQLREIMAPLGRAVVGVELKSVLHLKSAVTALPDGTLLGLGDQVDRSNVPAIQPVPEEAGAHIVALGGRDVLIAASAPRTASLLKGMGYKPVVVDISEFERLEGGVTCLSVLVPNRAVA